jgi:hypothetical protein
MPLLLQELLLEPVLSVLQLSVVSALILPLLLVLPQTQSEPLLLVSPQSQAPYLDQLS